MGRVRERRCLRGAAFAVATGAAAVTVAACGGSGGGSDNRAAPAATTPPAAANTPPATVATRSTALGTVLTDGSGRTLYLFEKDTGPASTCYGACASAWPPLTVTGRAMAGAGVKAALLTTTKRTDGTTEVTYNGHPLYYFAADKAPGDVRGQDVDAFGADWYVLSPAGSKVEGHGGAATPGTGDNPGSAPTGGSDRGQTSRPGY